MKTFIKVSVIVVAIYGAIALCMLAMFFFYRMYASGMPVTDAQEGNIQSSIPAPVRDPELGSLLQQLAVDDVFAGGIGITYVDGYPDSPLTEGQHNVELYSDGTKRSVITVKKDGTRKLVIIGHEYMHAVWENMPEEKRSFMSNELNSLLASDTGLQGRVQWYRDSNKLTESELFSIYCTESSDAYLSVVVLAECNTHIDRSLFTFER